MGIYQFEEGGFYCHHEPKFYHVLGIVNTTHHGEKLLVECESGEMTLFDIAPVAPEKWEEVDEAEWIEACT